jgi:glutathione S-transferase
VKVSTKTGKTEAGGDYRQINPKGYMPALELDDGERLTEAAVLLQRLAGRAPAAGLTPAHGKMECYRLKEWLNFIATEIHKGFAPPRMPTATDDEKERARARLSGRLEWVGRELAGRDYLTGNFSIADAYLFTILNWGQ